MRSILTFFLLVLFQLPLLRAQYTPDWASLDQRPTPEWWLDAKFGIFIHWGVYSVPAYVVKGNYAEWYQHALNNNSFGGTTRDFHKKMYGDRTYYDLADDFKALLYNPDDWAQLFSKSGAKYIVLTSKHHDGFALWPSSHASKTWGFPWNAVERGPKRDLMGDLFTALRKTDVKPGFYFSWYEWFNPLWKKDRALYAKEHAIPQLRDAVERYKPWVIWGDGEWDSPSDVWGSKPFLSWLYNESAIKDNVVTNDRFGSETRFQHAGIYTPEYQPDLEFEDHAWEESRGMGHSYGYNRVEDAWDYNATRTLVLHLIDKVSRGGNFLLDIGPDGFGQIPPIMQQRLLEIGDWMKVNGEAIYGTRRWQRTTQWSAGRRDFKAEQLDGWRTGGDALLKQTIDPDPGYAVKEIFFTWKPSTKSLYAIFPKYPDGKKLTLKDIQLPQGTKVTFLATGEPLWWEIYGNNTVVHLPEFNPNTMKNTEAYVLRIAGFGDFVAKPTITTTYNPQTLLATVSLQSKTPGATIRYTTDGSAVTATSPVYDKPFTLLKTSTLRAQAFLPGLVESAVQEVSVKTYASMPALKPLTKVTPGLQVKVQSIPTGQGRDLASALKGPVVREGIAADFTLDTLCKKQCAMTWTGVIDIAQTGGHQFWLESDDGSQLFIGDVLVVDNSETHGLQEKTGYALLQKGKHNIKVTYCNKWGDYGLNVRYAPLGQAKTAVPTGILGH